MTMPHERTRSVIQTREFLQSLLKGADLPPEITREAYRLLRHYPTADDVLAVGRLEEHIASGDADSMLEAIIQLRSLVFSSSVVFKRASTHESGDKPSV